MPRLFALTLFTSATLLFLVQPMVGKLILPLLGGTPAAWTTCMVFFQTLLLIGYLYAHFLTTRLEVRAQTRVHLAVLGVAALWLAGSAIFSSTHAPIAVARGLAAGGGGNPVLGVLGVLAVAIGVPFLVVSTSAPLLTRWFADTNHKSSRDPYFLYTASNAGSLIALLGYPLFVEPAFTLAHQAWLWAGGFALLFGLVALCGAQAAHPLPPLPPLPESEKPAGTLDAAPPSLVRRAHWLALAFVPSSLMLGVTTHMTTDIASVPLLWVIPLALYLVTFIVAFGRTPAWLRPALASGGAVLALLLVFVMSSGILSGRNQAFEAIALHLGAFFVLSLVMHGELARLRPAPARLTEYFLWISLGGVLGGLVNGLLAPLIFPAAYEYPATLALACFLIPATGRKLARRSSVPLVVDFLMPLAIGIATFVLLTRVEGGDWFDDATDSAAGRLTQALRFAGGGFALGGERVRLFVLYALPCMAGLLAVERPLRFGLAVAAVLALGIWHDAGGTRPIWSDRSYFGVVRVEEIPDGYAPASDYNRLMQGTPMRRYNRLLHGTTMHGTQDASDEVSPLAIVRTSLAAAGPWQALAVTGSLTAFDPSQEPLTYYHRTGPVSPLIRRSRQLDPAGRFGMVGLGTGSVAAYLRPGDRLTYYEIDALIVGLVERGDTFTFVKSARGRGADVHIVLGDARLELERSDEKYQLLLIDAFSSDAIPVHLLTREAIELYGKHLEPHGVLGIHVSNSFMNLRPVVARLAADAGLAVRVFSDDADAEPGKATSTWIALARTEADLGDLAREPWEPLVPDPAVAAWTDDYADVLRVMTVHEIRWARRRLGLPVAGE